MGPLTRKEKKHLWMIQTNNHHGIEPTTHFLVGIVFFLF
jgi:hypothetical protein